MIFPLLSSSSLTGTFFGGVIKTVLIGWFRGEMALMSVNAAEEAVDGIPLFANKTMIPLFVTPLRDGGGSLSKI